MLRCLNDILHGFCKGPIDASDTIVRFGGEDIPGCSSNPETCGKFLLASETITPMELGTSKEIRVVSTAQRKEEIEEHKKGKKSGSVAGKRKDKPKMRQGLMF